ncbi:beta-lactamase, partial [Reticulomyxa filosa]
VDLSAWPEKIEQTTFSGIVHVATSHEILLQHHQGFADRAQQRAFDKTTVFDIGSLTKQFVAIAIMRLVEQGKLETTATLDQYFPMVPADKKPISIHQLLTHSSGLPTNLANHQLYDKVEADAFIRLAWQEKLVAKPAEKYNYSNIGYGLLAHIIEKVSGQPWELFIQQHILLPSGLKNTGYRLVQTPVESLAQNYGADPNWLQRTLGLQAQSRSIGDPLMHLRQDPGARWFEGAGGF